MPAKRTATAPTPATPEHASTLATPEQGTAAASKRGRAKTAEAARDVVAAISYRADGTPDQSEGFAVIERA